MKKKLLLTIIILSLCAGAYWQLHLHQTTASTSDITTSTKSSASFDDQFDKTIHSTTDPKSIWVVVNKQHPLVPASYVPDDLVEPKVPLRVPGNESMLLRRDTAVAVETMFAAAEEDNLHLMISSGYRSYAYQVNVYAGYVRSSGQAQADTISARPGHSEHQTGLSLDVEPTSKKCEIEQCFGDTPEGHWIHDNAYKYGFIIRYTPDKVAVTGYSSEPWHIRYIGSELAAELHNKNIQTLEEFFDITGGQSY